MIRSRQGDLMFNELILSYEHTISSRINDTIDRKSEQFKFRQFKHDFDRITEEVLSYIDLTKKTSIPICTNTMNRFQVIDIPPFDRGEFTDTFYEWTSTGEIRLNALSALSIGRMSIYVCMNEQKIFHEFE